jgi:hypothetical protein
MITTAEAFTGLYAAWRLFLRDARAITLFDATPLGAIKSFSCALIVLPGYALVVAYIHSVGLGDTHWFRFFAVETIAYVVTWCAWPLLMFYVTTALDKSNNYLLYVTAFNWSAGPQMLVWLTVLFFAFTGIVSREVLSVFNIAALIIVLVYHLFIMRTTLKLTFFVALGLVIGEMMLSQFINQARETMLR